MEFNPAVDDSVNHSSVMEAWVRPLDTTVPGNLLSLERLECREFDTPLPRRERSHGSFGAVSFHLTVGELKLFTLVKGPMYNNSEILIDFTVNSRIRQHFIG